MFEFIDWAGGLKKCGSREEIRYIKEGFENDHQLAVFDLLSKDVADIEKRDIAKIKKVAVDVLTILQERKQQMSKLRPTSAFF